MFRMVGDNFFLMIKYLLKKTYTLRSIFKDQPVSNKTFSLENGRYTLQINAF